MPGNVCKLHGQWEHPKSVYCTSCVPYVENVVKQTFEQQVLEESAELPQPVEVVGVGPMEDDESEDD